jgi:hypothetical protein
MLFLVVGHFLGRVEKPTRLTQRRRSEGRGKEFILNAKPAPYPEKICSGCGATTRTGSPLSKVWARNIWGKLNRTCEDWPSCSKESGGTETTVRNATAARGRETGLAFFSQASLAQRRHLPRKDSTSTRSDYDLCPILSARSI